MHLYVVDICSLVLLVIQKNWNMSILGVVPSIYRKTIRNLTVQIWFRYQPPYRISGSFEGTTLKITKTHTTCNGTVASSSILVG